MNPHCECQVRGFCMRHQMKKGERQFQLCKGIAKTSDCGFKYWRSWELGFQGATIKQEEPILEQDWECDETAVYPAAPAPDPGLGDKVSAALSLVGITEERVSAWIGRPCGCSARKEKLNKLGRWVSQVLSGDEKAKEELTKLID